MYRFIDKRFHHKSDWTFDLRELSHAHIGLGRNYEGPAHLKRNLEPAIAELESIGFLEPLPTEERFFREGKDWKIRLIQKGSTPPALSAPSAASQTYEPEPPALVTELTNRGVTRATAAELVSKHTAETIHLKIDVFDWLVEKQDKRVAKSPAGYLVKSINDDYAAPKGFVSRAERQQQREAQQARERQAAEDRRRKQQQDAREHAEKKAILDYWESLPPPQQAELQAAADASTDAEQLAKETGPLKTIGQMIRRHEHIRRLLASREQVAAEG